jgi:hypothetical protein
MGAVLVLRCHWGAGLCIGFRPGGHALEFAGRKIVLNGRDLPGVIAMNGIVIEELIWSLGPQLADWHAAPLASSRGASRPSVTGALKPKGRAKVVA